MTPLIYHSKQLKRGINRAQPGAPAALAHWPSRCSAACSPSLQP